MQESSIPPAHPGEVVAFLQTLSTAELVDVIELAASVFARAQTVYNFHIPGRRSTIQVFYVQDLDRMFEELRHRLPMEEEVAVTTIPTYIPKGKEKE